MDRFFKRPLFFLIPLLFVAASFGMQADVQARRYVSEPTPAPAREVSAEEYVASFAPIAIEHKEIYGIPASVKMAQAMLESSNGNSDLARRSNNHFGIKCKTEWTGEVVYHDDDEAGECFRKYATIAESFTDHSEFLCSRKWYAPLFELAPTDYKGWARGLKEAGYATDKEYAEKLIALIEKYELYLLDSGELPAYCIGIVPADMGRAGVVLTSADDLAVSVFKVGDRDVFLQNGTRYVIAKEGDSYESIARQSGIRLGRLLRLNGKSRGALLSAGDAIYIEKMPKNK